MLFGTFTAQTAHQSNYDFIYHPQDEAKNSEDGEVDIKVIHLEDTHSNELISSQVLEANIKSVINPIGQVLIAIFAVLNHSFHFV